jgi:hypothetical protein
MTEERASLAATGSVMLDIGEDVGALVVHVDSPLLGHEVEARPLTGGGRPAHADVLERHTPQGPLYAVVIPGLLAGRYSVWLDGSLPWGDVEVSAGEVTELDRR